MPKPYQHALAQMPYHVTDNESSTEDGFDWKVADLAGNFVCACESKHNADMICRLLNLNT